MVKCEVVKDRLPALLWWLLSPSIDPETWTEHFRKNLLHLSHSLGDAHRTVTCACIRCVNTHRCSRSCAGGPWGCAAYGSVWLQLGGQCSLCERGATNQWLRSPTQGSERIPGRVRGTIFRPHDGHWCSSVLCDVHPPPAIAQGEGIMGGVVKGEMEEDLKPDAAEMKGWSDWWRSDGGV